MSQADFESFTSVAEAEKRLRQATAADHANAINSHADALEHLNKGYEAMFALTQRQTDQIDVLLDSVAQLTRRIEALEVGRG